MSIGTDKMVERLRNWNENIRPMIERREVLPIDPERQICVFAFEGNAARFAAIFRNVWDGLPSEDRDTIYSYWCKGFLGRDFSPRIELSGCWARRNDELGMTSWVGHRLVFHAPSVDRLSDAAVTELVAHELAHVFQMANHPNPYATVQDGYDPWVEIDADSIVQEWGFEVYVIEEDLKSGRLDELRNSARISDQA